MSGRALSVEPGRPGTAALTAAPEPDPAGGYEVAGLLVGLCGTDAEIIGGHYGAAPAGEPRLVLGHEALGRVTAAPSGADLRPGDLVVPIVRRPDPVPCPSCAAGEWDMCRNGRFTEHGIKEAHGFARGHYPLHPDFAVAVPERLGDLAVLVEPASVVAKAWEHIDHLAARSAWRPRTVLVTGAGPIGLLAALVGGQRGLEVHVLDRVEDGPKPDLVAAAGWTYHSGPVPSVQPAPDVIVECTGAGPVVLDAIGHTSPAGIVCLTGLSSGARSVELDAAALNRRIVLENDAVFGSVNANRRHYVAAVAALSEADPGWLRALLTRRVPLERWSEALTKEPDDIKVALDLTA